jgi:hypothetical protein
LIGIDAQPLHQDSLRPGRQPVRLPPVPAGADAWRPKEFITEQVALFTANIYGTNVRQLMPYGLAEPHGFAAARWSPDGAEIISEKPTGGGSLFASTALGLPRPS